MEINTIWSFQPRKTKKSTASMPPTRPCSLLSPLTKLTHTTSTRTNTPTLSLLATTAPPPPPSPQTVHRPNTPTSVTILLTLIRLVDHKTDLAITLNVPEIPEDARDVQRRQQPRATVGNGDAATTTMMMMTDPSSRPGFEGWMGTVEEMRRSLEVRDWGLFVNEEQ